VINQGKKSYDVYQNQRNLLFSQVKDHKDDKFLFLLNHLSRCIISLMILRPLDKIFQF
jgi:hypothetical protein